MLQPTTTRPIENPSARERTRPSPWAFVPSLYFLQGMPYFVVDTCTTTFFKALEVPVASIGHSSLLMLPWTLKPLWSSIVDLVATKRLWTIAMQFLVAAGLDAGFRLRGSRVRARARVGTLRDAAPATRCELSFRRRTDEPCAAVPRSAGVLLPEAAHRGDPGLHRAVPLRRVDAHEDVG